MTVNTNKTLFLKFKAGSYKIDGAVGDMFNQPVPKELALDIINSIEYITVPDEYAESVNESLAAMYDSINAYGTARYESDSLVGSYS